MSKVSVLGSGQVGEVLANGFLKAGHEVLRGSRDPQKLSAWVQAAGDKGRTGTFAEAGAWGEVLVLAVKGSAAQKLLEQFGWDVADMGKVEAARAIEPLCMLWCIPGLNGGSWTHAFKLLRL